jgi:hypothetical protein
VADSCPSNVVVPRGRAARRAGRPWRFAAAVLAFVLLSSCAQQPPPSAAIAELRSTSSTSVVVVFDQPVTLSGAAATAFAIRGPDGVALDVVAVHPRAAGDGFVLATAPQSEVAYELSTASVAPAGAAVAPRSLKGSFAGSLAPAPVVGHAVALSGTELLVAFVDPATGGPAEMGDGAEDPASYAIEGGAVDVVTAAFGLDRSEVVLTTTPQADGPFEVVVGAVFARTGERLLDPFNARAPFIGIGDPDLRAPEVTQAASRGERSIWLRFSKPVDAGDGGDPATYAIIDEQGAVLTVSKAVLNARRTEVLLTTMIQVAGEVYEVGIAGLRDDAGNAVDAAAAPTLVVGTSGRDGADVVPPRVANVASTGNRSVIVTFSEPVLGGPASSENPTHYRIYTRSGGGEVGTSGTLLVLGAQLDPLRTAVTLTTGSQSAVDYVVEIVNVKDLAGNQIAPPERALLPSVQGFRGTAPSPGEFDDSDGDGLTDDVEQRGWTVTVRLLDGTVVRREVTSDIDDEDTDGDGILDFDERHYGADPRNPDTDGDGLTDWQELNRYYSDPTSQDSDGDGFTDGLEALFFGTSPLLADTDGDQLTDDYEILTDNRNPRVADLPVVGVRVGVVDLRLDVRFEETTSSGSRTLDSRSVASTLTQSQESAQARETSSTFEWFVQAGAEVCIYGGCEEGKVAGAKFSVEGGVSGSTATTFSTASVSATQREYATSLGTEAEVSAESAVTRVVEGASMAVEVNLVNRSNIAFTISDIEVTALLQDPRDPSKLVPVATLFAASGAPISIGPLTPERGPFRFVADNAFPNLVESLMANPRGLLFRVANYTIVDEFGRNFAFVEQDVNDRTAFLEVNFAGNLPIERYQIATNATFDDFGRPVGVTMAHVLENILGLAYVPPAQDALLNPAVRADADLIDRSYSTRVVGGVDTLWRIKGVSRTLTGQERDWWVLGPLGNITTVGDRPGLPFREQVMLSDQDFAFAFVQDLDQDDLEANEEAFYRSIDSAADVVAPFGVPDSRDSDRDGIADADEVYGRYVGNRRVRWLIGLEDGRDTYTTMAHPARADTDGDGLTDCQELLVATSCSLVTYYRDADGVPTIAATSPNGTPHTLLGTTRLLARTDPSNPDTDGDGLTDLQEAIGFAYTNLARARVIVTPTTDAATPYATNPLNRDTDRDGLDDVLEVRLGSNPLVADGDTVRDDDGDGLVNLIETTPRNISVRIAGSLLTQSVTSDPKIEDTDGDGLTDWEEYHGCRDANRDRRCDDDRRWGPTHRQVADSDADGLGDRQEVDGVDFPSDSARPFRFTGPVNWDTDGDGTSDGTEVGTPWLVVVAGRGGYTVWSDPLRADADGDGLNDGVERGAGTDPNLADSDGDGALDGLERLRATNPLVPDHLVTVTYLGVQAGKNTTGADSDCDAGSDAGDFIFDLNVRVPLANGALQLRNVANTNTPVLGTCTSATESGCRAFFGNNPSFPIIQLAAPNRVTLSASTQFPVAFTDVFTLEGQVSEVDDITSSVYLIQFGYAFGGPGDPQGVYEGTSLKKGSFVVAFNDAPIPACPVEVTVQVRVE